MVRPMWEFLIGFLLPPYLLGSGVFVPPYSQGLFLWSLPGFVSVARSELAGWVTPPRLIRVFWRSIEPKSREAFSRFRAAHQKPTEAS